MARSQGSILVGAIVAVLGYSALHQLAAFVGPSPTSAVHRRPLRHAVILAAISQADVDKAEKDAKMAVWAAEKLASEGAPQAAMMQAKASSATQAFEALKQQFQAQESGMPAVPVAAPAAPVAAVAPAAVPAGAISQADVDKAEKDARLAVWAAEKLAAEGAPQASMMQAKASSAVQALEALKQQFQAQEAGKPAAPVVAPAVSVSAAPAPAVAAGAVSKDDVEKAEKDARLFVWAAQKLAAEGAPQTAMMQAKADKAVQALEALRRQFQAQEAGAPAVPTAPVASAAPSVPAAPAAAVSSAPSAEEVAAAKKTADLQAWALKTLVATGAPEAAAMQAKAAASAQKYEALKAAYDR